MDWAIPLSHHSSNPLELRTSDPSNDRDTVRELYNSLKQKKAGIEPSSDELSKWDPVYYNNVKGVVGYTMVTPKKNAKKMNPKTATPFKTLNEDRDTDMGSEDELILSPDKKQPLEMRKECDIEVEEDDEDAEGSVEIDEDPLIREPENQSHESKIHEVGEEGEEKDEERYEETFQETQELDERDVAEDPLPEDDEEMREPDEEEDPAKTEYESDEEQDNNFSDVDEGSLNGDAREQMLESNHDEGDVNHLCEDFDDYSSPLSSRSSTPDEYKTLSDRPKDEQQEINNEIRQLYNCAPEIVGDYELIDRLGTGTFSSVYKAVEMRYYEWDNDPWKGHHPPESSAYYQTAGPGYKGRGGKGTKPPKQENEDEGDKNGRVYVAVKRIYTTSGPDRIRNELSILSKCRGTRHTSQVITAFRYLDQVVVVMPYQRNMDFRDFFQSLHLEGIKCYLRCLFRALRDIHDRGIIHRDVKPANFLYDPFTGIGTLCDFGLASTMEAGPKLGQCLHTPATSDCPHGRLRVLQEGESEAVIQAQKEARMKSREPSEKVGWPEHDRRPVSKANRAGTRGFRAPEVLLKCSSQSGAVDVWSAGVILLFFLTGKFPLFQSNDDIEGLMEIAVIIGKKNIEKVATLHGRTIATNVPDIDMKGVSWTEFVERLNPDIRKPGKYDMRFYPHNSKYPDGRGPFRHPEKPEEYSSIPTGDRLETLDLLTQQKRHHNDKYSNPPNADRHTKDINAMFSFLERVMHFDATKRFTPRMALYDPFLAENDGDDDLYVPHVIGEGVCGKLHFEDEEERHWVKTTRKCLCLSPRSRDIDLDDEDGEVDLGSEDERKGEDEAWCGEYVDDFIEVQPGQGIAIGNRPCEFHAHMEF